MDLPKGITPLSPDGRTVIVKSSRLVAIVLWLAVVLFAALGLLFIVWSINPPRPEADQIPVWGGIFILVLAAPVAWVAYVATVKPLMTIDDEGFRHRGGLAIRWANTERIELSQPRGNALWFTAPGGISRRGKVLKGDRVRVALKGVGVRRRDLQAYLVARAQESRNR